MNNSLQELSRSVDSKINKKADSDIVTGIDSRVKSLESSTSASSIVSTVRKSTEYMKDLSEKVDSTKVIAAINSSKENELINKDKIDFDSNFTLNTIYTSDGINVSNVDLMAPPITIDNIIDNIDFDVNETDLTMKAYKIRNTNYITNFPNDANIYMNNNEIIKLLLYEIKDLRKRITELENKGGE
jgi:predicted RND superfamily exporter protein